MSSYRSSTELHCRILLTVPKGPLYPFHQKPGCLRVLPAPPKLVTSRRANHSRRIFARQVRASKRVRCFNSKHRGVHNHCYFVNHAPGAVFLQHYPGNPFQELLGDFRNFTAPRMRCTAITKRVLAGIPGDGSLMAAYYKVSRSLQFMLQNLEETHF